MDEQSQVVGPREWAYRAGENSMAENEEAVQREVAHRKLVEAYEALCRVVPGADERYGHADALRHMAQAEDAMTRMQFTVHNGPPHLCG